MDYQSQAFKKFSNIFIQARAKRDLYDTSRMIKGDFKEHRWISRDLEDKHSMLEFDQDLAGTSRDVNGSQGNIPRVTISQRARGYFT